MMKAMKAKSKAKTLAASFFEALKGGFSWFYKKARTEVYNKLRSAAKHIMKQKDFLKTLVSNPK